MSWALLVGVVLVLGLALSVVLSRREELEEMREGVERRELAVRNGAEAQLQSPVIDLSRCLGCGTCVRSCPEDGVLDLVHGQAAVINPGRCVGVAACERECPVGAITVTLGDLSKRDDVPALAGLEAEGTPGLFLAGEVTAHALIKTAVEHGSAVGEEVARRKRDLGLHSERGVLDLCIVGAGPAGLACSLEAKKQGLKFVTIDQERGVGGTVAKYPRRKLVLTQPVEMPLYGRLDQKSYTKEELMDLWSDIAHKAELPIRGGEVFGGLSRDAYGRFVVRTEAGNYLARNVCLALGRRGVPRMLGVPGEELPKVAYSLIDAASYQNRRVLVIGGGDTAVETALGLSEQPGNQVTLSYRKETFFRIRKRNEERLEEAVHSGRLTVVHRSHVRAIHPDSVELTVEGANGPESWALPNDDVFIMAGGVAPTDLLKRSGVSFDRDPLAAAAAGPQERGTGVLRALAIGLGLSVLALVFALWHQEYYLLPPHQRAAHLKHDLLRPSQGVGLWLGVLATLLIGVNLFYLVRRSDRFKFAWGSLQGWMTSHVATGILAFLFAMLHGGMEPRDTVGGQAFWALFVLIVTGAIGRYFYAWVPRAANGRELDLEETRRKLDDVSREWDAKDRKFSERAQKEMAALARAKQWKSSFFGRVLALIAGERDLSRVLGRLRTQARAEGVPVERSRQVLSTARRVYRASVMASHYEDLRAVLASWRYLHRWVAVLMVILVLFHIVYSLVYTVTFFDGDVR